MIASHLWSAHPDSKVKYTKHQYLNVFEFNGTNRRFFWKQVMNKILSLVIRSDSTGLTDLWNHCFIIFYYIFYYINHLFYYRQVWYIDICVPIAE